MRESCKCCGSEHCGGMCYTVEVNPYGFSRAADPVLCGLPGCGRTEAAAGRCLLHAEGAPVPQKRRVLEIDLRRSTEVLLRTLDLFLKAHPPAENCSDCAAIAEAWNKHVALEKELRAVDSA